MISVEIKGFQSLEHVTLQVDGYTAIVGRSNIGKSAIVRAIKCALTGSFESGFLRHDPNTCARLLKKAKKCACQTSVRLKFDNDVELFWEKGDKINQYTVTEGGKTSVYNRVGRNPDMPDFLKDHFTPVKLGDRDETLQIAGQFSPVFLLGLSGTVVADILCDLGQLESINKAMTLVTRDRKAAVSKRRTREEDLQGVEAQLLKYDGLPALGAQVKDVREAYSNAETLAIRVGKASTFLESAQQMLEDGRRLKKVVDTPLGDAHPLTSQHSKWATAVRLDTQVTQALGSAQALEGVEALDVPRPQGMKDNLGVFSKVVRWGALESALSQEVSPLSGVPHLTLPSWDSRTKEALSQVTLWLESLTTLRQFFARVQALAGLQWPGPSSLSSHSTLAQVSKYISDWESLMSEAKQAQSDLAVATKEEQRILEDFKALGVCPACSQSIGPDHGRHA